MVDRVMIPERYEKQIFKAYHEGQLGGHCGREPAIDRIRRIFLFRKCLFISRWLDSQAPFDSGW
jgi:hypothetical protein